MDYQDEVDLGSDLWMMFQYDDSLDAAEAMDRLLRSAHDNGYSTIIDREGHVVHVFNVEELKRLRAHILPWIS